MSDTENTPCHCQECEAPEGWGVLTDEMMDEMDAMA